jgi:hypothetical protein
LRLAVYVCRRSKTAQKQKEAKRFEQSCGKWEVLYFEAHEVGFGEAGDVL